MIPPRIADAQQARLLLDPAILTLVHALMREALSAAETAEKLGLSLRRACTLLGKLHRAGIAEVVQERPRAGRAVKVYAVYPLWRVPFEFTQAASLEELMWQDLGHYHRRLNSLLAQQMEAHSPTWDFWLSPGRLYPAPQDGSPDLFGSPEPIHCMIGGLMLRDEDAREFKRRLLALQYEYEDISITRPGPVAYALSLTLTRGQWWGDEKDSTLQLTERDDS